MGEAARPPVEQGQDRGDRRMGRSAERQGLDQGDAQGEARLGVFGQPLGGGAVDQEVEIDQPAERLGRDRMGEGPIVGAVEAAGGGGESRLQRQPFA